VDAEIWCGIQMGPEGSLADEAASRGDDYSEAT
jgi:hypothetical protein